MPLTPEDVQAKRFTVTRFKAGYDEEEVDAFLDEVEAELRRLLAENADLRSRLAAAPATPAAPSPPAAPPPPTPGPPVAAPPAAAPAGPEGQEAALRTLLLAQRTADEAVAQAKAEAGQIVATAQAQAASLETEARQRHAAEIARLGREQQDLEARIEALRGFEREYRTRLRAYLESQIKDLESRSVEPPLPQPGRAGGTVTAPPSATPPVSAPPVPPVAAPAAAPRPFTASAPAPSPAPTPAPPSTPPATDMTDIDERRDGPPGLN